MDAMELWWNQVGGPSAYLRCAAEQARVCGLLLIQEPALGEEFIDRLHDLLLTQDSSHEIPVIDAGGPEIPAGTDLMAHLLRKIPDNGYHPMDGSAGAYLGRSHLLKGRLWMVRHVQERPEWMSGAADFAQARRHGGGLIFLYDGECPMPARRPGTIGMRCGDYFSLYDLELFASLHIAEAKNQPLLMRRYIVQLAVGLCGGDARLCWELATPALADDPPGELRRAGAAETDWEPIAWEAQIQVAFPVIEQGRRYLIEKYAWELQERLKTPMEDEYHNRLLRPEDMELRHIRYCDGGADPFLSAEDRALAAQLVQARNNLAHLKLLGSGSLRTLLEAAGTF